MNFVRDSQFAKALSSIVHSPLPRCTVVRLSQLLKASPPISVTLLGMATDVRPVDLKAELPISSTLLGMVTDVRFPQPPKAESSIFHTLLGMETDVWFSLQPKVERPISVTPSGMETDVRLHSQYILNVDNQ